MGENSTSLETAIVENSGTFIIVGVIIFTEITAIILAVIYVSRRCCFCYRNEASCDLKEGKFDFKQVLDK